MTTMTHDEVNTSSFRTNCCDQQIYWWLMRRTGFWVSRFRSKVFWLVVKPPLWKVLVNWDDSSQYFWENNKWQPNHQPVAMCCLGKEMQNVTLKSWGCFDWVDGTWRWSRPLAFLRSTAQQYPNATPFDPKAGTYGGLFPQPYGND